MSYKDRFDNILKIMESKLINVKRIYKNINDNNNYLLSSYNDLLEYEILLIEYKKYNRDTLNSLIMDRIEDEIDEFEDLYEDFISELNDFNEEYEDINEDNIENIIKDSKVKSKDEYEDYNFEEEELEEDDFYYEDLD